MAIIESITGVFDSMLDWFVGVFDKASVIFYNSETGLTLVGVLAICALGLSVCFLFLNVIKGWLRFGR